MVRRGRCTACAATGHVRGAANAKPAPSAPLRKLRRVSMSALLEQGEHDRFVPPRDIQE
jgi:hypothetical protein